VAASPQRGTPDQPADAPGRSTLHLQLSPLLLIGLLVGILSTVALVVSAVIAGEHGAGPPPGSQPNPPPPPPPHSMVPLIVSVAVFVVAWVTVAVAAARDHLVRRIVASTAEAARDREAAQTELVARLTTLVEFGEQRETDAYINGMKAAEKDDGPGTVRPFRTVPPPRRD
jgi:hypothetical protein